MQARSIGSASQLSHRAAAARSANPNSARSSTTPLTWPKRWNLTESDHVAPGRAGRSARSRWNVKGLSCRTGSTALGPGRKRTKVDGAEDGCVVRSERGDGASSGWAGRSEALEMALFDHALFRPSRNTPPLDGRMAARSMRSLWMENAPGRRPARVEDGMRSMKPVSRRCGRAGSMPRALRFQEGRTFCADLSETTALVPSKRLVEGAIGWVGLDRSAGTRRVVGWVWADTLIQEAAGPRLDAHLAW